MCGHFEPMEGPATAKPAPVTAPRSPRLRPAAATLDQDATAHERRAPPTPMPH